MKGECEVDISEISYPSLYQNDTGEKFTIVDGRESSEEKLIVVAMNNNIRERLDAEVFDYNGIYVTVAKITK